MLAIRLTHVVPKERKRRYYNIAVQRDLFAKWILEREWGRLGQAGAFAFELFDDILSLLHEVNSTLISKTKKGYVLNELNVGGIHTLVQTNCGSILADDWVEKLSQVQSDKQLDDSGFLASLRIAIDAIHGAQRAATSFGQLNDVSTVYNSISTLTTAKQHVLDLTSSKSNVTRLLTGNSHDLLDCTLRDLFGCYDRQVLKLIEAFEFAGATHVGQIIQFEFGHLCNRYPRLAGALLSMKIRLQELGLDFGARAPRWRTPSLCGRLEANPVVQTHSAQPPSYQGRQNQDTAEQLPLLLTENSP